VENNYALANDKTIEGPADTGSPAWAQFKQPIAECARVRQTKIWTMFSQKLNKTSVVGEYINRP